MKYFCLISLFLSIIFKLNAQSGGFSEGKNLAELRNAVYSVGATPGFIPYKFEKKQIQHKDKTPAALHPIFLPRWSAEELPFFCKIEHDWGLKSRVPIKFRLGSVEYVDWLEGKN